MRPIPLRKADPLTMIVPKGAATFQIGAKLNTAPFNVPSRYQQVYDKSEFASIKGPVHITELAFRPVEDQATRGQKIERIQLRLSTFKPSLMELSTVFDKNLGRDETIVFDGPLTLRTRMRRSHGNTLQCDMVVVLSKPFIYNCTEGSLLLDIRNYTGANSTFYTNGGAGIFGTTRLVFNDLPPGRADSGVVQDSGLVTQFKLVPVTK